MSFDPRDFPTSVTPSVSLFDRFAYMASRVVSRPLFFAGCVLLVAVWWPTYFLFRNVDTWQLIINTATTIITFLMVALLQNSQQRADQATQHKLNAIARGLADLMDTTVQIHPVEAAELEQNHIELRQAIGLEHRESAS